MCSCDRKPKLDLPFELRCDASDFAVRAILEFDIKIQDKKGIENFIAYHLSRIENDETSDDSEIDDNFPGVTLMEIDTRDEPWFTDFVNYLVSDIIPKGMTYQQKNNFFSNLKHYFWEEPYLFKVCSDGSFGIIPSSKRTKFKCLWSLESKIEDKKGPKLKKTIRDYVDQKSTIHICTFVGCCLTSGFSKKQTALATSTTEAEYISAEKTCQQELWMKQALIDYDI
ncbi:hypothetical protein Tco_1195553 [Tanacetum coccineum]